jgi:peroxiredoxin
MKLKTVAILGLLAVGISITPMLVPMLHSGPGEANTPSAMNFTLTDLDGVKHSLGDFKGKVIVLEWTNPGCPFVVRQYKDGAMQSLQKKLTEQGVVWLSISSTNPEHADYIRNEGVRETYDSWKPSPTSFLIDSDGTVGKAWGAKSTPHMFVIDQKFNVAYQGAIDNNPRGNKDKAEVVNYVDQAVSSLLAGKTVETSSTQPYGCSVKYANK